MDLFALEHMDKETLLDIFPRHGPRIRFEQKRKE